MVTRRVLGGGSRERPARRHAHAVDDASHSGASVTGDAATTPRDAGPEPVGGAQPPDAGEPPAASQIEGAEARPNELLRQIGGVFANVAVITALLVFFGWQRSEVYARGVGIDQSILAMSTQDYLLRSVQSVLILMLVVAAAGLLWLWADRVLTRRLEQERSEALLRRMARLLRTAPIALPFLMVVVGALPWVRDTAFVAVGFPLSVAGGLLLAVYAFHLRQRLPGAVPLPANRERILRMLLSVIVAVAVFTAASNYAEVEGEALAADFPHMLPLYPGVILYSAEDLHLEGPGVRKEPLEGEDSAYRYRYRGLRLIEHTGGRYFLVADRWDHQSGVVVMLDNTEGVRLEFARDNVDVSNWAFEPQVKRVEVEESIVWANHDLEDHHLRFDNGLERELRGHRGALAHFSEPGRYAYRCILHDDMTGIVVVEAR